MNKYSEIIKSLIKKFNFKIEHADSWYKRNEHYVVIFSNIIQRIVSFDRIVFNDVPYIVHLFLFNPQHNLLLTITISCNTEPCKLN